MDRIVFVPLYPNYSCFQTGFLLNAAVKTIRNITVALPESVETNDSHRITPMSGVSFDCSVVDRWGTHPAAICVCFSIVVYKLKRYFHILLNLKF